MAKPFKLKSGNKTSFKMMGSSPIKQTTNDGLDDDGLYNPVPDIRRSAPWSQEAKDKLKDQYYTGEYESYDTGIEDDPTTDVDESVGTRPRMKNIEEGWDYSTGGEFTDPNVSRYKSKEEIRQDKKDRKLKSKGYGSEGGKKYTKEERYKDRMKNLADKYQRARGEGSYGVSFDWRNMLLGGDIASGFTVEPKKDILARKIEKKASKKKSKELKETRKTQRDAVKAEQKAYKKYKKQQKKSGVEAKDFDHWKRTLGKKGGGQSLDK
jgi:hypothetical protein